MKNTIIAKKSDHVALELKYQWPYIEYQWPYIEFSSILLTCIVNKYI